MAYARKSRGGGGAGGAVTIIVILALLGGVGYVVWWKINQLRTPPPKPTDARSIVEGWMGRHRLKGELPDRVGSDWQFSLETSRYKQKPGDDKLYPMAWVDVLLERDRFTALVIAAYRDADEATAPVDLIEDFAEPAEGRALRTYVGELGRMSDGSTIEKETTLYRFFGWRQRDESCPRKFVICIALKDGGARTDELYAREKAYWDQLPKKPAENPG